VPYLRCEEAGRGVGACAKQDAHYLDVSAPYGWLQCLCQARGLALDHQEAHHADLFANDGPPQRWLTVGSSSIDRGISLKHEEAHERKMTAHACEHERRDTISASALIDDGARSAPEHARGGEDTRNTRACKGGELANLVG
jgi:hypothetical protein